MLKCSVIIPTKDREDILLDCLQSVVAQSRQPFEIIVVDQNNPLSKTLMDYVGRNPLVRHIQNIRPGLVQNYNAGLNAAKGEVVIFLDDDIIADSNLIKNIEDVFEKDNGRRVAAIAGRVNNRVGDLDISKIREVGRYHSWTGKAVGNFNFDKRREVMFAQGAQMSFRREKLLGIQGFDEGFTGNGYFFETDACLRLLEKGYTISFEPQCIVQHLMAPRGGARLDKVNHTYYFIRNGIRLQKRHSFFFQRPFFWIWSLIYVIMKAIYNRNAHLLSKGLKAILDGLDSHQL